MSDYIKKSEVLKIIEKETKRTNSIIEHNTQLHIKIAVEKLPTVDEKEIIRKTVERIVERLNEQMPIRFNGFGKTLIAVEDVIKILKEECGISE